MRSGNQRGKGGFTLVEVLVAAAIGIVVSSVIIAAFIGIQNSFVAGIAMLELHSNVRLTMDWIVRDLKWARQIEDEITVGAQTYTTADNELVLMIPAIDGAGDIINNTYDFVIYHVNGTSLERIVSADSSSSRDSDTYIVANNVQGIIFSSGGTGLSSAGSLGALSSVTVSLTTGKTVLGGRALQQSLATTVRFRNI